MMRDFTDMHSGLLGTMVTDIMEQTFLATSTLDPATQVVLHTQYRCMVTA